MIRKSTRRIAALFLVSDLVSTGAALVAAYTLRFRAEIVPVTKGVPDAATYVLQAATDPNFPVVTRIQFDNIPNTTFSFAIGNPEGNYSARVFAVNANGIASAPVREGATPLVTVSNPPPVQVFLPGFSASELRVEVNNVNNLRYRPDGKLLAVGYDGRIWLLHDSDGDGSEDMIEPFWDRQTLRAPIGAALTPPGYARGNGVFVAAKDKLAPSSMCSTASRENRYGRSRNSRCRHPACPASAPRRRSHFRPNPRRSIFRA